jgi:RimJ/RimL family protein N-acetyltransferase
VPASSPSPRPARPPAHRTLEGQRVRLVPVDPARHAPSLYAATHGPGADPELWTYLPYGPFDGEPALRAFLEDAAHSEDPLFFAIEDRSSGAAVGVESLLRIAPRDAVTEVGHVWFGTALQRTPAATEAIFLLARHAFDDLGNRRMEWKCDAANARSRRAAERLGFTYEGTFRQHMIVKGRSRDTAWFSLLDHEWPAARSAFERWLAPENFDADGAQRRRLADLRACRALRGRRAS